MRTQAKTAWSLTILALIFAAVLLLGPLHAPVMGQEPPPGYERICLKDGTCIFVEILDRIKGLTPRIWSRPLVPVGPPNPAVLQISNQIQPGGAWWGSAVAVKWQGRQVVLSVAHLLSEGMGKITVHTIDGRQAPATLIAVDNVYDLSAWRCDLQTDAVTIAVVAPAYGDLITQIGFGGGSYHANVGTVVGYGMTAGSPEHRTLEITGQARVGDSGGPMLNTAGELVAIQASIDGVVSRGTYCGQIIRFLNEHIDPGLVSGEAAVENSTVPLAPLVPPNDNTGPPEGSENAPVGPAVEQEPLVVATPEKPVTLPLPIEIALPVQPSAPQSPQGASDAAVASNPSHAPPVNVPADDPGQVMLDNSTGAWDILLTMALPILTGLGWTTPPSAAALVGIRMALIVWRRRKEREGLGPPPLPASRQPPVPEQVISVEPPAIVATGLRDREFVPYETPSRQLEALEYALDEYVKRHPGARSMVETIEVYASQHVSAHPKK